MTDQLLYSAYYFTDDISPAAKQACEEAKKFSCRYPFDALEVGGAIIVPFAPDVVEGTIRNAASKASKVYKMGFKVLKHDDTKRYEIVRVK